MKNTHIFTLIMVFGVMTISVYAQEKGHENRNEFRFGYGMVTAPEVANSLLTLWPAIGIKILDSITDYNASFHGVANMDYNRKIAKWCTLGGSLSINPVSTIITTKGGLNLTWNYYIFNLMPRINFCYLNREMVTLYSGLEAGAALVFWKDRKGPETLTDTDIIPAYHINFFGLRVGKQIAGFIEWGYGHRGMVNVGVSARY
jgi:hypothetical protein